MTIITRLVLLPGPNPEQDQRQGMKTITQLPGPNLGPGINTSRNITQQLQGPDPGQGIILTIINTMMVMITVGLDTTTRVVEVIIIRLIAELMGLMALRGSHNSTWRSIRRPDGSLHAVDWYFAASDHRNRTAGRDQRRPRPRVAVGCCFAANDHRNRRVSRFHRRPRGQRRPRPRVAIGRCVVGDEENRSSGDKKHHRLPRLHRPPMLPTPARLQRLPRLPSLPKLPRLQRLPKPPRVKRTQRLHRPHRRLDSLFQSLSFFFSCLSHFPTLAISFFCFFSVLDFCFCTLTFCFS